MTHTTPAIQKAAQAIVRTEGILDWDTLNEDLREHPRSLARAALADALDGRCEATLYGTNGQDRVCDSPQIVGYRQDVEDDAPWPVCADHAWVGHLVPLHTHLLGQKTN